MRERVLKHIKDRYGSKRGLLNHVKYRVLLQLGLYNKYRNIDFSKIILTFVKVLLILIAFILAFDVLELQTISSEISNLLRYLPKLLGALVLFTLGLYIANFIKKAKIQNLAEWLSCRGDLYTVFFRSEVTLHSSESS